MPPLTDPNLRRALSEHVRYLHELGIYDFYRRETRTQAQPETEYEPAPEPGTPEAELREEMPARKSTAASAVSETALPVLKPNPEYGVSDPVAALKLIREEIGPNCTRCALHKGRTNLVFGVGNPHADLMFVGEGPGADEDAQGEPFVGRSGQLLNNMIKAMGLSREDVYIANVVKCRPPNNRAPERDESETCSPYLMRQITVIKPKVVVALGATAAKNLLAYSAPMTELRGKFYDFLPSGSRNTDPNWQGTKLVITYHPAFLLRDPRQKGEAWKDLQMVMKYLGLKPPAKTETPQR